MSRRRKLESVLEGFFSPLEDPADAVIDVESLRSGDLGVDLSDQSTSGQPVLAPPIVGGEGAESQTGDEKGLAVEEEGAGEVETQVVVFDLAGEQYGVDVSAVNSIIKMQYITAVPRTPDFIEGVTNLRGTVLPVVDLRRRFGLPLAEESTDARIVVVEVGDTTIGMKVDGVTEVLRIPQSGVESLSPIVNTVESALITGLAKVDERLIILLDLSLALGMGERASLEVKL